MSAVLRVMLKEDVLKLRLPSGIPQTVEELTQIVKETYAIEGYFLLEYQDQDFRDEFFTLINTQDIEDKCTIRVVFVPPLITLSYVNPLQVSCETEKDANPLTPLQVSCETKEADDSFSEADTMILSSPERSSSHTSISVPSLSSPESSALSIASLATSASGDDPSQAFPESSTSSLRSQPWPAVFEIPTFSLDTEIVLDGGNLAFKKDGTLLDRFVVKGDILQKLVETVFVYTPYPSPQQKEQVFKALIKKHPCLRDRHSDDGITYWLKKFNYKIENYRAKMRMRHSLPELSVNTLKRKSAADKAPAKKVKKAKKSETNYLPPHPEGETDESLEMERVELLLESKKKDNKKVISEKMAKTFSLRRKDVILKKPKVIDFQSRWPALFEPSQVKHVPCFQ